MTILIFPAGLRSQIPYIERDHDLSGSRQAEGARRFEGRKDQSIIELYTQIVRIVRTGENAIVFDASLSVSIRLDDHGFIDAQERKRRGGQSRRHI